VCCRRLGVPAAVRKREISYMSDHAAFDWGSQARQGPFPVIRHTTGTRTVHLPVGIEIKCDAKREKLQPGERDGL
jgi:hypothetical protein